MLKRVNQLVALSIAGAIALGASANESDVVRSHSLTVEQKLELLETIEVTSKKEIDANDRSSGDQEVDSILDELAQLESSSDSSE